MKILYGQIKELVPRLRASAREVGEALTMKGYMMSGFESIRYKGKKDILIDLEVRQNRADLFSVMGIAREVAAYYGLSVREPACKIPSKGRSKIKVEVKSTSVVRGLSVVAIDGVKNGPSPKWLREYLSFYDINSVSLLVDLSNYAMLVTGVPSHIFDQDKVKGHLVWTLNKRHRKLLTLNRTELSLGAKDLVIEDDRNALALSFIGGDKAEVSAGTSSIIAEVGVYDPGVVRENAKRQEVTTDAGQRLDKELDPQVTTDILAFLVDLILEYSGGSVASGVFEFRSSLARKRILPIAVDAERVSSFAGIPISLAETARHLRRLGFSVRSGKGKTLSVTPPPYRTDVREEEDVIEEVTRMVGFETIPKEEVPAFVPSPDITPLRIRVADRVRDILTGAGMDEALSLPMTTSILNEGTNCERLWEEVVTQNAVNEEFPALRQSLAPGLLEQGKEYQKKNISKIGLFEIGKVFGKQGGRYIEAERCGVLVHKSVSHDGQSGPGKFREMLGVLFGSLGMEDVRLLASSNGCRSAVPGSEGEIVFDGKKIGFFYGVSPHKVSGTENFENAWYAEVDIEILADILSRINPDSTAELTQKLVVLDGNIELKPGDTMTDCISRVRDVAGDKRIWSIEVADRFTSKNIRRYTLRVSYRDCEDEEAKKIHRTIFG